ncbi:LysR family transcriptional regulator [Streptomyces sp. NPDC088387]|uniref:LysR family transcriptional regulator n=1 Tax=Streptomyces sp. NPDC088387 TaxID=3365859 RepID=UPI0037F9E6D3
MQFHHLKAFRVVAAELSFTRAAAKLHCAQSTMTAQIQQLERSLGVELFRRRGRCRVELTEAGLLLQTRVDDILAVVDTAQREIRELQGGGGRAGRAKSHDQKAELRSLRRV